MSKESAIPGLEILASPVAGGSLVEGYLRGDASALEFFAASPNETEAYARKASEVGARLTADARQAVREAIHTPSDAAGAKLERILAGDGVLVTTGQQAGLFGGPLFTVYKALTAVQLANTLERTLGMPVAPAFWVAADDHDWAEVNHIDVVDVGNEARRIELPDDGPAHPMSVRPLPDAVGEAVDAFLAYLPDTEFTRPYARILREAYRPGVAMAAAFASTLARLLAPFDLLVIDPAHPALKRAAVPHLAAELDSARSGADRLAQRSVELDASGYGVQVTIAPDVTNVFFHDVEGRDRIAFDDGGWYLRRSKRRLTEEELRAALDESPERFSPNVLLRPVIEAAVLPTVAYVGGPSEIAYFAQIGPLFETHQVAPTVVHPRTGFTLVESRVRKVLGKFGLEVDDFAIPLHELQSRVARDEMPDEVQSVLREMRESVQATWSRLADGADAVDPTLRGWLETQRNHALSQTENAEKKIASHVRKQSEIAMRQLEKGAVHLYPNGTAQQRSLSVFQYLARYGPDLLHVLADNVQIMVERPTQSGTAAVAGR